MKGLISKFTLAIYSMAVWLRIWNCQAVILLDSLDQLNPDDGALQLAWLPTKVPDRVKIVVSTLPDKEYECLPRLQVSQSPLCDGGQKVKIIVNIIIN
jgi:hypothetical protein